MIGTSSKELIRSLKGVFPVLTSKAHKGQNGRVAIIGGSFEFTGAPFYSAISSVKAGGDLAHIFCSKLSSHAIKSYSPEAIVHPVFISQEEHKYPPEQMVLMYEEWLGKIKSWEKAIHSWVIGPGLGRDKYMNQFFPILVKNLPENSLVIFDADAIYYLDQHPQLFDQLKRFRAILTPNLRQLLFVEKYFKVNIEQILRDNKSEDEITKISNKYSCPNFKLLIKGPQDIILGNDSSYIVRTKGGLKRCGGMGDILSGVTAVCSFWDFEKGPLLASRIMRLATRKAYEKEGRGLTAPYVIKQLTSAVKLIEDEDCQ